MTKVQAHIKGILVRNQFEATLIAGFKMIMRICRRLSDGKLYYIFLMQKL